MSRLNILANVCNVVVYVLARCGVAGEGASWSAEISLQPPLPRKAKIFHSGILRQKCVKFYGSSLSPILYNRTAIWLGFS